MLVIRKTKIDSEAVECASKELSKTMYIMTYLGLSDLSIKGKYIAIYTTSSLVYMQLIIVCCVLKIHLEVAATELDVELKRCLAI